MLKLDKAIIYLLVDWSGPERVSRSIVYKALNEHKGDGIPTFQIDCSDQTKQYFVKWLNEQGNNKDEIYFGGYGEIILVANSAVKDYIKNPGQHGLEKVREKLNEWNNQY